MIILPILTTPLIHFCLKGWENVLFELGSERVRSTSGTDHLRPLVNRNDSSNNAGNSGDNNSNSRGMNTLITWNKDGGEETSRFRETGERRRPSQSDPSKVRARNDLEYKSW